MRSSRKSNSVSAESGQVFVEYALVAPLVLASILAAIQIGLLAIASVRVEAAVNAAARSYIVHGSIKRARQAAAYVLVPSAVPLGVALSKLPAPRGLKNAAGSLDGFGLSSGSVFGNLSAGLSRYIYAYAHTHVAACFARYADDQSTLIVKRGDPVRIDLYYDVPLLVPMISRWFADGDHNRSDSAYAALQASPYRAASSKGVSKIADAAFNRFPKRRLSSASSVIWARTRSQPEPAPICI